jgi:hypothetical protein
LAGILWYLESSTENGPLCFTPQDILTFYGRLCHYDFNLKELSKDERFKQNLHLEFLSKEYFANLGEKILVLLLRAMNDGTIQVRIRAIRSLLLFVSSGDPIVKNVHLLLSIMTLSDIAIEHIYGSIGIATSRSIISCPRCRVGILWKVF